MESLKREGRKGEIDEKVKKVANRKPKRTKNSQINKNKKINQTIEFMANRQLDVIIFVIILIGAIYFISTPDYNISINQEKFSVVAGQKITVSTNVTFVNPINQFNLEYVGPSGWELKTVDGLKCGQKVNAPTEYPANITFPNINCEIKVPANTERGTYAVNVEVTGPNLKRAIRGISIEVR